MGLIPLWRVLLLGRFLFFWNFATAWGELEDQRAFCFPGILLAILLPLRPLQCWHQHFSLCLLWQNTPPCGITLSCFHTVEEMQPYQVKMFKHRPFSQYKERSVTYFGFWSSKLFSGWMAFREKSIGIEYQVPLQYLTAYPDIFQWFSFRLHGLETYFLNQIILITCLKVEILRKGYLWHLTLWQCTEVCAARAPAGRLQACCVQLWLHWD